MSPKHFQGSSLDTELEASPEHSQVQSITDNPDGRSFHFLKIKGVIVRTFQIHNSPQGLIFLLFWVPF